MGRHYALRGSVSCEASPRQSGHSWTLRCYGGGASARYFHLDIDFLLITIYGCQNCVLQWSAAVECCRQRSWTMFWMISLPTLRSAPLVVVVMRCKTRRVTPSSATAVSKLGLSTRLPLRWSDHGAVRILRKNAEKYFLEKREERSIYVSCRHSCVAL